MQLQATLYPTTLPSPRHSFVGILMSPTVPQVGVKHFQLLFSFVYQGGKSMVSCLFNLPTRAMALVTKVIVSGRHWLPTTKSHVINFILLSTMMQHFPITKKIYANKSTPRKHASILLSALWRPYPLLHVNLFRERTPLNVIFIYNNSHHQFFLLPNLSKALSGSFQMICPSHPQFSIALIYSDLVTEQLWSNNENFPIA